MNLYLEESLRWGSTATRSRKPGYAAGRSTGFKTIREAGSRRKIARGNCGFSLLELLVAITVLMVIASAVISVMSSYQKTYQTTQLKADMYLSLRGVSELMAQEIGQAGLLSLPSTTLGSPGVTALGQQNVRILPDVTAMFVGENLLVDQGPAQELVTLTIINVGNNNVTAVFNNFHAPGAPINVQGVFPYGILPPGIPTPNGGSSGTSLRLFGDLNGDGTLVYVQYDCIFSNPPPSPANNYAGWGKLTRSITLLPNSSADTPATLLSTLIPNPPPASSPCFRYTLTPPVNPPPTPPAPATINGYNIVTNVAVTLSLKSTAIDPVAHSYLTMTKSFMDLTPRNLLGALELAYVPAKTLLQPTPTHP